MRIVDKSVPLEHTDLIGRAAAIAEVTARASQSRMVTIVGPIGVGKTRLAIRSARTIARIGGRARTTIAFVRVGETKPTQSLDSALTTAYDCDLPEDSHFADWAAQTFTRGSTLVVLDGCEHRPADAAQLTELLLSLPADIRVLATSDGPLGCEGEMLVPLGGLTEGDTEALFTSRASAVLPSFTVSDMNREQVRQICMVTGGIPLAVELVAARIRVFPIDRLVKFADSNLLELRRTDSAHPAQAPSLRTRLEDLYSSLGYEAQSLWRSASIFGGEFDLDALAGSSLNECATELQFANLVQTLIDRAVVRGPIDAERTTMELLPPFRLFGREKHIEAGEEAALLERAGNHFVGIAERAEAEWMGPKQLFWYHKIGRQIESMSEIVDRMVTNPVGRERVRRIVAALRYYWVVTNQFDVALRWLRKADSSSDAPTPAMARALQTQAYCQVFSGDLESAVQALERSREVTRAIGMRTEDSCSSLVAALVAIGHRRYREARGLLAGALEAHKRQGLPAGDAVEIYFYLGLLALNGGFDEEAQRVIDEALCSISTARTRWGEAMLAIINSMLLWRHGEVDYATAQLSKSMHVLGELQHAPGAAACLEVMSRIETSRGNFDQAISLLRPAQGSTIIGRKLIQELVGNARSELQVATGVDVLATAFEDKAGQSLAASISELLGNPATAIGEPNETRFPDRSLVGNEDHLGELLSPRELEVARLVSGGLSSPRIAERLFISPRTVEGHIQRILRKGGFLSRTEIGVWYVKSGRLVADEPRSA